LTGVADGRPQLGDGTVLDVASVVWCTGFKQVFDWIGLPVLDERGWPAEYRGVVDAAPGLYFCGLSFQYAFSSMVFPGISRDADYVARQIVARAGTEHEAAA
jgi:putative flavoprotein involved in K+ transport